MSWIQVIKTQLMLFVTMMLIRGRKQIDQLIWAIVISVGFFGVKGGIWTLTSGGENRVWGPPGTFIEGNNELGLALAMLMPLMYYLAETTSKKWIRYGMWVAMGACAFSILGSHSRGAFLAIGVAALFLGIKSHRPILITVILVVALAGAVALMPDNWIDRMGTIETYQKDASARAGCEPGKQFGTWCKDRPIVGAGFDLANPQSVRDILRRIPDMEVLCAAQHLFPGAGRARLRRASGCSSRLAWRSGAAARNSRGSAADQPGLEWVPLLMRMVQVSLLVFAAGGAFLGLLHYDLPYYLAAIVVLVEIAVTDKSTEIASARPARFAIGRREKCLKLANRLLKRYYGDSPHPYRIFEEEVGRALRPESVLLDAGCGRTVPVLRKFAGRASRLIGVELVEFTDVPKGIETYPRRSGEHPGSETRASTSSCREAYSSISRIRRRSTANSRAS